MNGAVRVLLVDDQELVRTGLRGILRPRFGFHIVGELDSGVGIVETATRLNPHVVVMDVRMPVMDGITATRLLTAVPGAPPVLVLTTFEDDEILAGTLRAGAAGFLLKGAPAEDLADAAPHSGQRSDSRGGRSRRRGRNRHALFAAAGRLSISNTMGARRS